MVMMAIIATLMTFALVRVRVSDKDEKPLPTKILLPPILGPSLRLNQ
jgi:hypothetical protein